MSEQICKIEERGGKFYAVRVVRPSFRLEANNREEAEQKAVKAMEDYHELSMRMG